MPVTAAGLTLNVLGALFLYLLTPKDFASEADKRSSSGAGEANVGEEVWLPDQHPERIIDWLQSWNKKRFGFLLLTVGFGLQLLGFFVPGSRIVA